MDPIMRRVGLTGKGIMPLIMGFAAECRLSWGRGIGPERDRMTLYSYKTTIFDLWSKAAVTGVVCRNVFP